VIWQIPRNIRFEDLQVGLVANHQIKISGELIDLFAKLTGDHHPLHIDQKYALENGFRDRIAHGALISSCASKLIGMNLPGEKSILIGQESDYLKPVYPKDSLDLIAKIIKIKKSLRLIIVEIEVKNQFYDLVAYLVFKLKFRDN